MDTPGDLEKVIGPLEAEIVRTVVAAHGPVSVRAVLETLNVGRSQPLAYTTVMTVMSRLADKDILKREPRGRGYVYESVVGDAAGIAVRDVLREFGDAAVARFVDQARADPKILRRLERLLTDDR